MPHEGIWWNEGRCVCVLRASGVMGVGSVCVLRASGVMGVGSVCVLRASGVMEVGVFVC